MSQEATKVEDHEDVGRSNTLKSFSTLIPYQHSLQIFSCSPMVILIFY